ncbi:hypothetical protein HK102_005475 [Quaeritorhiza haematococci]|nr:hypothetical protein HK102_005475 [Quaeritorhiza haematococci]
MDSSTPAVVDLYCEVLQYIGPSLKELGLWTDDNMNESYLCQIADACPESLNLKKLSVKWRNSSADSWNSMGFDFGSPPDSGERSKWTAGFWYRFRGETFGTFGRGSDQAAREFAADLVAFWGNAEGVTEGRGLSGEEVVLLGKSCPNLKAYRCHNMEILTNEEMEEFLSTVGRSFEFFSATIYRLQHLHIIARHCRSVKHLHVIFYELHDDEADDELYADEPTSIPQAFEDLLRNIGSTILTLSLKVFQPRIPIAQRLLPTIRKWCPRIRKLHILDAATTTIKDDVEQLFKHCKNLVFIKHDALGNCDNTARVWNRPGASPHYVMYDSYDFDEYVETSVI